MQVDFFQGHFLERGQPNIGSASSFQRPNRRNCFLAALAIPGPLVTRQLTSVPQEKMAYGMSVDRAGIKTFVACSGNAFKFATFAVATDANCMSGWLWRVESS